MTKRILMKKVLLALSGLILLAILAYFCFQNKADTIREHLVSSTNSALSSHNISGVTAALQGHDIEMTDIMQLTGEVPSPKIKAEAEMLTRAIEGIGGVDNQLSITQQVAVTTPMEEKVEDAVLPDTTTVATPETSTKVATLDPYTLNISKDEEGNVVLEGYVDDTQHQSELIRYAEKLFGSKNVTDNLKVASGAPKDWEHISTFALERLKDVDYGDMKLSNQSYEFTGHLPSPSTKASFLNGIREVMSDPENKYSLYRGDYIITAPVEEPNVVGKKEQAKAKDAVATIAPTDTKTSTALCQTKLDKLLKNQKILFDYNKASIKNNSYTLLNNVLKSLKACHVSLLEIAGHTDDQGAAAYNKKLSDLRAASVKKYFIKKGFDKKKLKAIGYGESRPIASNKSSQGRAENRRIEFIVKGVEK